MRRGFGPKVGPTTARSFAGRVRGELVDGHPTLSALAGAMLAACEVLGEQLQVLDKRRLRSLAREDARTKLLMTIEQQRCSMASG